MQQTLELVTSNFHSLLTHDYNVDGLSEIIIARIVKNGTDVGVIHPKALSNCVVRINDKVNTFCIAQTSLDRSFELITGDYKGVVRINAREGKAFFQKSIKDGIRLPSAVLCAAPGDLNGNRLSEIMVGCKNGEVVMIERIPGRKHHWDQIRGFSLGQIFSSEATRVTTGDFNGNGQVGFVAGARDGTFKEIEFRPQLQKFDLVGEFRTATEPSCCFSGDIDRDGIIEVVVGEYSGQLNVFKRNVLVSKHELDGAVTCGAIGDVDNDGQLEVVAGTNKGTFYIIRQNTIESFEGYGNIADLRIADITGNRQSDLVFSINKRRIIAFNIHRDKKREQPNVDLIPLSGTPTRGVPTARPQLPLYSQPATTEAFCPNCNTRVRFIAQYRRWFCDNCRQYIAPVSKQIVKSSAPLIEGYAHGSPYEPVTQPSPEATAKTTVGKEGSAIEKAKSRMASSIESFGQSIKDFEWQEDEVQIDDADAAYFLPLDLESDPEAGVQFFNDLLKIKHIILIHSLSGVPLFSQSFGKDIDVSLISGFLSAVGTFTEEMAGETEKRVGVFSELGREGFWILIYEGGLSKAALLIGEKLGPYIKKRIKIMMKEFEKDFREELEEFSGFVSAFSGAADLLEKHLKIDYLYPLRMDSQRMRLTAITASEKKLARTYTEFQKEINDEAFYVSDLIDIVMENKEINIQLDEVLKILIKYHENDMLISLPPPPEEPM